jgi:hypothetical protein
VYHFSVTNPYDYDQLFYFRTDGIPADWSYTFAHAKRFLSAHERYEGTLTIQPPEDAKVCTDHRIDITSWMPKGNTLVQYGGATLNVNLRNRTTLTANTTMTRCDRITVRSESTAKQSQQYPRCIELTTSGCTNPPRPNEEIIVRYEDPDGNPVYRVVTTDALGCYSDTYVVTDGGEWTVTVIYEGSECSGGTRTPEETIPVPIPTDPDPDKDNRKLWYSAHVGSTHPLGSLNDIADANIYVLADLMYPVSDRLNLQLLLGIAQTSAEVTAGIDHPRWFHASANVLWVIPRAFRMKPYLRAGGGVYRNKSGSTNAGANIGIGGLSKINDQLYITPGLDYHFASFGKDENDAFITAHLGIMFR